MYTHVFRMCVSTNFKITTEPLFSNTGTMVQSEFRRKVSNKRRSRYLVPGFGEVK